MTAPWTTVPCSATPHGTCIVVHRRSAREAPAVVRPQELQTVPQQLSPAVPCGAPAVPLRCPALSSPVVLPSRTMIRTLKMLRILQQFCDFG